MMRAHSDLPRARSAATAPPRRWPCRCSTTAPGPTA